jgi:hypothetical protein
MSTKLDCDADSLLDEANTLSLSVPLDARKAFPLIDKLRSCADQARDIGLTGYEKRLRQAAETLQQRLATP